MKNTKIEKQNTNKIVDEFSYLSAKALESIDDTLDYLNCNIALIDKKGQDFINKLQMYKNRLDKHFVKIFLQI